MRQYHPKVQAFLNYTINQLIASGVTVHLSRKVKLPGGYGGSFGDDPLEFTVAMGGSFRGSMSVYVHEYGHYLQWLDDTSIWHDEDHVTPFFNWLEGEQDTITKKQVYGAQMLELDCEKKAVELIKDFDLPINLDWYIKCANAYLFSYNSIYKRRKWTAKKSCHRVKKIYDMMPTHFLPKHEYKTLPPKFDELVDKYCFNKT